MASIGTPTAELINTLMQAAIEQAKIAASVGEVPVGAVLWHQDRIVSAHHNLIETNKDASAHAEMLVIREGSQKLGDWRLNEAILCVTLEPCTMCSGAIRLSRVGTVIYGAADPRMGAVGSLFNICEDPRLGKLPKVMQGARAEECQQLLSSFFSKIRA